MRSLNLQSELLYHWPAPLSLLESGYPVVIIEESLAADHPRAPSARFKHRALQRVEYEQSLMHATMPVKIAWRPQAVVTTRLYVLAWRLRLPEPLSSADDSNQRGAANIVRDLADVLSQYYS